MATVLVTIKIMPETVDTDLGAVEEEAREIIEKFGGIIADAEKQPIAFGLNCLNLKFGIDESNSNLDPLEDNLRNIHGVVSAEVTDVRRAIG